MKYFIKSFSLIIVLCFISFEAFCAPTDGCFDAGTGRFHYSGYLKVGNQEQWNNTYAEELAVGDYNCKPYIPNTYYYVTIGQSIPRAYVSGTTSCWVRRMNGSLVQGSPRTYSAIYYCPIDDYMPYFILILGSLGFLLIKRSHLA